MSRVAIVGSGIAGLVAAHTLRRAGASVDVLEVRDRPAITAHAPTFVVDGESRSFDTLLVWPEYHGALATLVRELGLTLRPNPFDSTSFFLEGQEEPYFWYDTRRLGARAFIVPGSPRLHRTVRTGMIWAREALRAHRALAGSRETSVREHIGPGPTEAFRREVFPWLNASLGFTPSIGVLDCPARAAASFQLAAIGRAPHVIAEGMPELARRLLEGSRFLPGHTVTRVLASENSVRIVGEAAGAGFARTYDHVVLAIPPRRMADVLDGASAAEANAWSAFAEDRVSLVAHSDPRVMPGRRDTWRTVSYTLPRDPARGVEMTILWDRLAPLRGREVFFTWNSRFEPDPALVLYRAELVRVLPSVAVQGFLRTDLPRLQGRRRVWYTGVWARPDRAAYLEDGVVHARAVAAQIAGASARHPRASASLAG